MQASTMCGCDRNELRVSRADCASENTSAAVLLDPAMAAAETRSVASSVRKDRPSYTARAVQAINMETPQVTRIIPLSFWPIDALDPMYISAPVVLGRVVDKPGQREQL